MKNLSFLHSPVVYSSNISAQIRFYFKRWEMSKQNSIERNHSFINFIKACEDENKDYLTVIDTLKK